MVMHSLSDYEAVVKLSEDFNGADLRNVCTEAGETSCHTGQLRGVGNWE